MGYFQNTTEWGGGGGRPLWFPLNFVVPKIKFGVLIEFDKFTSKQPKKLKK